MSNIYAANAWDNKMMRQRDQLLHAAESFMAVQCDLENPKRAELQTRLEAAIISVREDIEKARHKV